MAGVKFKPGDLVEVESMQKRGWGDEYHKHLVLVLRTYKSNQPPREQHYPLSAYLDETSGKAEELYEVLRDDGKYLKLGLKDYAWPGSRRTSRLVQETKK